MQDRNFKKNLVDHSRHQNRDLFSSHKMRRNLFKNCSFWITIKKIGLDDWSVHIEIFTLGQYLLSGGYDKSVVLWDMNTRSKKMVLKVD